MHSTRLTLLGSFQLIQNDTPIHLDQSRLMELVARLALQPGQPLSRQRMAYDFWPDSSEKQARTNVRNLLYKLKRAWPTYADVIKSNRRDLVWRMDAPITVDAHGFEAALGQAEPISDPTHHADALAQAAACYAGDLLPDLYSDWAMSERERLRGAFAACLETLIPALLDLRRPDEALTWAKTLQRHDPLHESACRLTMTVYAALGDRAAALRTYHACATLLETELGVEPAPTTQALYDRLLNRPTAETLPLADGAPQATERPRLVGRQESWQKILAQWRQTRTGQPHLIVIWGEAGMGKTRLAEELVQWVARRGYLWASSRSYAAQGALVYAPVAEWFGSPMLRPRVEKAADLWRVELARLIPDLLAQRPDLPGPGPLAEDWQRRRFYEAMLRTLLPGEGRPVLLHLDDMQWTDSETLAALSYLMRGAEGRPLLILGTARSEEAQTNPDLAGLLTTARKSGLLTEVALAPLSFDETVELAAQTAGTALTAAQADTLYALSEGHPLFLVETVRAVAWDALPPETDRGISPRPGQDDEPVAPIFAIPPKIQALLTRRLDQLSPSARQLAEVAAVVGREFDYHTLHGVSGLDELALVDGLDELWRHRIVREQGEAAYDFSHDRIREVAYGRISRARRRLIHRRVAQTLVAVHPTDLDDMAGRLAHHYHQAGQAEDARHHYQHAGEVALAQHALSQTEEMFSAALALTPKTAWQERFGLLQKLCGVYRSLVRLEAWAGALAEQEAIVKALAADPQATVDDRVGHQCAYFLNRIDQIRLIGNSDKKQQEIIDLCNVIIALAEPRGDLASLARAHLRWGQSAWRITQMAESGRHYSQAIDYAQQAGLQEIEAAALEDNAAIGMFTGMGATEIQAQLDQAMVLAQAMGHLPRMGSLLNKYGYLPIAQGNGAFEQAEVAYVEGLAIARQIGHPSLAGTILHNIGHMEICRGDYRRAGPVLAEAIQMGRANLHVLGLATALHYEGELFLQQGDFVTAEARLREADATANNIGYVHFRVKINSDLGLLYHLMGDQMAAEGILLDALGMATQHGDTRYEAQINVRLGYVREAQGCPAAARQAYAVGVDLHRQMEQPYYAALGMAGLARLHQCAEKEAQDLARQIWHIMDSQTPEATIESARTFATCCRILQDVDPPLAAILAIRAHAQLIHRAATIDDPARRTLFWQIPDHQAVLACHSSF